MPTARIVMSEEERQFAAEHHGLILSFLRSDSWELSEYYDIAAWGFLDAVIKYLRSPSLRKYPFSSLAWKSMRHSIAAFRRAEARRLASEQRYADTELPEQQDLFSELEAKFLLQDLTSCFGKRQYELASMRLQGYSLAEIARAHGISVHRVSKLLQVMYRAYLKLYNEERRA